MAADHSVLELDGGNESRIKTLRRSLLQLWSAIKAISHTIRLSLLPPPLERNRVFHFEVRLLGTAAVRSRGPLLDVTKGRRVAANPARQLTKSASLQGESEKARPNARHRDVPGGGPTIRAPRERRFPQVLANLSCAGGPAVNRRGEITRSG